MIQYGPMTKDEAIRLLGGTTDNVTQNKVIAAQTLGVSRQAIDNWPEILSRRVEERIYGVLYLRKNKRKTVAA